MTVLTLGLTVDEANLILGALAGQPYRLVVELIAKIHAAAAEQLPSDVPEATEAA